MPDNWGVIHLTELAARASEHGTPGAVWSLAMSDLNLNLMRFGERDGVEAHVNAEVDMVGVVIAGEGTLEVNGRQEALRVGDLFYVPNGARREIHADGRDFVYLTCHRRRAGLMPTRARH